MNLYLDKGFLDHFNAIPLKKIASKPNSIISSIFNAYGDVNIYLNSPINSPEDLEALKANHIRFDQNTPNAIDSTIEEYFFKNVKDGTSLIFSFGDEAWHKKAEDLGALCFSFKNYKKKIKKIIQSCEVIKVDLSQPFPGWQVFEVLKKLPKNNLTISDNFIIENRNRIYQNVINLIKIITTKELSAQVTIFTERSRNGGEDGKTIYNNLVNSLNDYNCNVSLILRNYYPELNFHDRLLYSNLFYIEIPIGFNFKTNKGSNSVIRVETIFDKFHYDRVKNHMRHLQKVKLGYGQIFSVKQSN